MLFCSRPIDHRAALQVDITAWRCYIAFANYCCSRLGERGRFLGGQKFCHADGDENVPILEQQALCGIDDKIASDKSEAAAVEAFTLQVNGIDCPDCLAKVRTALLALPGDNPAIGLRACSGRNRAREP